MPFPEQPALDSRHPRVKEWVSRFTEGDDSLRFGARMQLPPLTEPDALPILEAPELPAESEAPPAPAPPAAPPRRRATDPVATPPVARVPDPAPLVIVPEPIVLPPEPKVLRPDAVTPLRESVAPGQSPAKPMLASARDNRRKRRQRERERAAAAAPPPVPARPAAAVPAPPRAPAPAPAPAPTPVLIASSSPRDIIDESLARRRPALEPPPGRRNGPPRPPGQGRFMHVVVPGLLMLGVAAAAIIAGTRGGFEQDSPQQPVEATSSPPLEPALQPSLADSNISDSSSSDTIAPIAPAPLALTPTPADSSPARFCLAVGTYLFVDRARIISRQLERRTGLDAWVEPVASGGARNYRIMIGGFATQAQAEKVADRMLGRGLVTEAMVQPLPPDHVRQ
jgi:hypothetical protein